MRRTAIAALALLLASSLAWAAEDTPGAAATPAPEEDAGAHLDKGASLLYQGRYDEAIVEFEAALRVKPGYLKARLNLATAYYYKKDYRRAEEESLRCLRQDPEYLNARLNLAIIYQAEGKNDEALAAYHKVLEADPRRAAAWKNIGKIEEKLGDYGKAAEGYERSLAIDPDQKGAADLRKAAEELRIKMVEVREAKGEQPAPPAPSAPPPSPATPAPPLTPAAPTPSPAPLVPPPAPTPRAEAPERLPAPTPPPTTAPVPAAPTPPASPAPPAPEPAAPSAGPPGSPEILAKLLQSLVTTQVAGTTILTSAPLGSEVYLRKEELDVKDPFVKYGIFGAHKKSREYLALRSDIVEKKLFRGYTPLTLTLEEGHYQIAFRVPGRKASYVEDGNTGPQSPGISMRKEDLGSDVKIYELTIHRYDRPRYLVALFQEEGQAARDVTVTCAGDGPFVFDRALVEAALAPYGVDDEERRAALHILGCTGKAVLKSGPGHLLITLGGTSSFQVSKVR